VTVEKFGKAESRESPGRILNLLLIGNLKPILGFPEYRPRLTPIVTARTAMSMTKRLKSFFSIKRTTKMK
jgi:hypothetical protein